MSALLDKLNVEKYAGDVQWEALQEWENERGCLGIYLSKDMTIGQPRLFVFLMVADEVAIVLSTSRQGFNSAMYIAELIARFNGFEVLPSEMEQGK